ncbi:MAG: hypothetical protein ACK4J0_04125 [Candidatus Anstonellaceae archaeon]
MVFSLSKVSNPLKTGLGFGLISGTLTTLGVLVGIYFGTKSFLAIIGAIISVAIADAFSDSLAIHISEESKNQDKQHVFHSTVSTFFTKFFVGLLYLPAFLIFNMDIALFLDILLGIGLISYYSYLIAKQNKTPIAYTILEHLLIAFAVIIATFLVGDFINHLPK